MDIKNEITEEQVKEMLDNLWKQGKFMRTKVTNDEGHYEYMPKEQAYACGRLNEFISYKKHMKSLN